MEERLQLDDGYARIVHGVFLALAQYKMSSDCTRVLMVIFRMTYGFQRKEAQISLDKFQQMTGMHKPNIIRAINALVYHNIIIRMDNYDPPKYSYQKYSTKWKPWEGARKTSSALSKRIISVIQTDNASFKDKSRDKKTHGQNVSHTPKDPTQKPLFDPPKKPPEKPPKASGNGHFDRFWAAYPKKRKKIDAQKAWKKVIKDPAAMIDTLVKAVEAWKGTDDWQRESGRFIPYPATWLRAGQWADEIISEELGKTCSWSGWRERAKNADCKGQRKTGEG